MLAVLLGATRAIHETHYGRRSPPAPLGYVFYASWVIDQWTQFETKWRHEYNYQLGALIYPANMCWYVKR